MLVVGGVIVGLAYEVPVAGIISIVVMSLVSSIWLIVEAGRTGGFLRIVCVCFIPFYVLFFMVDCFRNVWPAILIELITVATFFAVIASPNLPPSSKNPAPAPQPVNNRFQRW